MELKKNLECALCNGSGELTTMESVYGGSDSHIQAPVGSEKCDNCEGTGLEPDKQIVLERCLENLTHEEEKKLQAIFVDEGVFGEIPITKHNCEDLFEQWLMSLDLEELINFLLL